MFHQLNAVHVWIFDQRQCGCDDFAKVVWRDVRRHTHSDTASAVDKHIWITGWQNSRFLVLTVVVVLEINCVFVYVCQQKCGRFIHTHLGITHRSGVIAIHRAKVTLTVQQRQRHREVLCHTHQSIINGSVTVWVIFTHNVAHSTRRLTI